MKTELARSASKYAAALLELALEAPDDVSDFILADLQLISQVVESVPEFSTILNHPAIASSVKKDLLSNLFAGHINELTLRLLNLLADKRRLQLLSHLEREYKQLWQTKKQIVTATLTSAYTLPPEAVQVIKSKLIARLGKKLELAVAVDESLLGGMVLRIGDQVLDGSLKGKLQVLERALCSV